MSTFILTALPLLVGGLFFIAVFLRKKDKNYLIPGATMLLAGRVTLVVGTVVG
ncbi:hypothetical protein [Pseudomonas cerasi]